jgi:four helix bundle protein
VNERDLKQRTKQFSLRIVALVDALPNSVSGRNLGNQLFRSGTSVGANYRAACRGRSMAEFASKLGVVEEEADESAFWLELLIESGIMRSRLLAPLLREANELTAIMVASRRTVGRSLQSKIKNQKSKIE